MASDEPRRILLIRPSALGDVCRSVPVLVSLRRAYPEAVIDWLVQVTFADAVRHHPALDGVVTFPRGELGKTSKRGNLLPSLRWMTEHLRPSKSEGGKYDLVIDAQGLFRSGLFARWTGARRRVGYKNAAEGGGVFYTDRFGIDRSRHAVDRMLALIAAAGVEPVADMRLYTDPAEAAWVDSQPWARGGDSRGGDSGRAPSASEGLAVRPTQGSHAAHARGSRREQKPVARAPGSAEPRGRGYAVLAPTSRWASKQWPAERFAELGRRLLGAGAGRVVIVGGPGEREQVRPLLDWASGEPRAVDLIGETTVARLMAVVSRASLVVANDSAALHMAVGFDRALVALFGPTRVERVGPYRRDSDVIQHARPGDRFEHKQPRTTGGMIERIGVEEVFTVCTQRLGHRF